MKTVLTGYGKMGKAVKQVATQREHQIISIVGISSAEDIYSEASKSANAAIESTTPAIAFNNYMKCFEVDVPVISDTTGWLDRIGEIKGKCEREDKAFFYASSFSIGVNIFLAMNKYLAKIMNNFPSCDVKMTEVHHIHKLDAPSRTAITSVEGILKNISRKDRRTSENAESVIDLPIHAIRGGGVPGVHEVTYEPDVDTISIKHGVKSRAGSALGAIVVAELTIGKKGLLGMNDLFKF